MIIRNLFLSPDSGAGIIQPKPNTTKIKIESNEGKIPEVLKDANFNTEQLPTLDDSEGYVPVSKTEEVIPDKKTEEIKKEEPEKEETSSIIKEEEKPEKEEEGIERFLKPPKGSQAEKDAKKGSKDTFDYSDYSEDEVSILKNMPVSNRDKVGKMIKDNKEYSKARDNQFFQSPDGYLLHPGYKNEMNNIQLAEKEARIWSKQLKDVKEGIAIKPLEGWNTKTGEPVYGTEVKATDELEEAIRNNMNQCMAVVSEKKAGVNNFIKNFTQLATNDMKIIRDERAKRFAWVSNPKLLDHTISVEGVGDKSIKQVRSDVTSLFPTYMRNNEAVEACGDLMVALMIAKAEISEVKKGKKIESVKKDEERSLEPSGDVKPKKTTEPLHGVKSFSTEGAGVEI